MQLKKALRAAAGWLPCAWIVAAFWGCEPSRPAPATSALPSAPATQAPAPATSASPSAPAAQASASPSAPAATGGSLAGTWRGTSLCLVKPSACHDETVVYRVTAGKAAGAYTVVAYKVVGGEEQDMGTVECHVDEAARELVCPIEKGTFRYAIDGDRLHGKLDLSDGTRFRTIEVTRSP